MTPRHDREEHSCTPSSVDDLKSLREWEGYWRGPGDAAEEAAEVGVGIGTG
jgi:hypothetical protein